MFFGLLVAFIYFAVHVVAQMLRDASVQATPAETGPMKFVGPGAFVGLMWVGANQVPSFYPSRK